MQRDGFALALLGYGLLNATLYTGLLPLWEGFDEPFHYGYVQHLRERNALTDAPQDIPALFKEVHADLLAECGDEIKQKLFDWAWNQVARGATGGLPEWYKEKLLASAFDAKPAENTADNLRTEAQDA